MKYTIKNLVIQIALLVIWVPSTSFAVNYYVKTSGNNSNNGTSPNQAWRTIQKAADVAGAGDVVTIYGGTYNEDVTIKKSGSSGNPLKFTRNGNDTVITRSFYAEDKKYVEIGGMTCQNFSNRSGIRFRRGNNNKIISCTIRNGNASNSAAVRFDDCDNSEMLYCHVYNNNTGAQEAVRVDGNQNNFKIKNNNVHDNSFIGIDIIGREEVGDGEPYDGTISYNDSWDNGYGWSVVGSGIYLDGCRQITVEYNKCMYNADAGIQIGAEPSGSDGHNNVVRYNRSYRNKDGLRIGSWRSINPSDVHNNTVHNNVFYKNNANEVNFEYWSPGRNNKFYNNIMYGTGSSEYLDDSKSGFGPGTEINYNCYYNGAGVTLGSQSIVANPNFENANGGNFRIKSGSPCINAGSNSYTKSPDAYGNTVRKGSKVDIGVHEKG
ncbi:MAG: right-handed parallel beta-helix repeat-containing protein [Verrucomicrobiota bacterium]